MANMSTAVLPDSMTTILLVDSDAEALASLSNSLQELKTDWHVLQATSSDTALGILESHRIDCFITEAIVDNTDCFETLRQVQQLYPATIRFTISDNPNSEIVLENARPNHRFVNKSVALPILVSGIESSLHLRSVLSNEALCTRMRSIKSLPALPEVYSDMMSELATPHSSLLNVGRIVEKDAGLTATVLKIVNSTFYGLSQRVDSVAQAVALLGVHLIKNIALTAKVFAIFEGNANNLDRLAKLNNDACEVGALANQFARYARLPKSIVDHSQIAGMLANVGELIDMISDDKTFDETSHTTRELLGAYLLRDWMMPDTIIEAVAMQYDSLPESCESTTPLVVVRAVRYLQQNFTDASCTDQFEVCSQYLSQWVDADIASLWVDAYQDLKILNGQGDHSQHKAA